MKKANTSRIMTSPVIKMAAHTVNAVSFSNAELRNNEPGWFCMCGHTKNLTERRFNFVYIGLQPCWADGKNYNVTPTKLKQLNKLYNDFL